MGPHCSGPIARGTSSETCARRQRLLLSYRSPQSKRRSCPFQCSGPQFAVATLCTPSRTVLVRRGSGFLLSPCAPRLRMHLGGLLFYSQSSLLAALLHYVEAILRRLILSFPLMQWTGVCVKSIGTNWHPSVCLPWRRKQEGVLRWAGRPLCWHSGGRCCLFRSLHSLR